jgi:hypothetical protein
MRKQFAVFIVNISDLFGAELAYPFAPNGKSFRTSHGIKSLSIQIEWLKLKLPQEESDQIPGQIANRPPAEVEICADAWLLSFQRVSDLHPFEPR